MRGVCIWNVVLLATLLSSRLVAGAGVDYKPVGKLNPELAAAALNLDPFIGDPSLRKAYDTDLKKKVFLSSPEGKQRVDELRATRDTLLNSSYDVEIGYPGSYDLKKGGMVIWLPAVPDGEINNEAAVREYGQSVNGLWLPDRIRVEIHDSAMGLRRGIFVKLPEDSALAIENEKGAVVSVRCHLTGKAHRWEETVVSRKHGIVFIHYEVEVKDLTFVFATKSGIVLFEKPMPEGNPPRPRGRSTRR
jgi:hypothetical protein